ncbi:EscU/YscU/HrcU family type III secretion system export apparatus switch protein [Selenomonas sp. ND2010]|jgi:flagellar biosynthesis protein|uniref:EscU/YscU/HrcU family type III secretion system export apparatus switch protein n=1 Tax=Selenomonas sp. ND2010 TaxID=1410618 RepID=UPI00051BA14C|nr:EscU/YscU/HrcU family type III secretion system export apparatus switch protein [Selenomonas sp. ND2010]
MKERHKLQEEPEIDPNVPQKAVALKYDLERDTAPRVVAKGRGHVAENILAAAQANTIPVYQNKTLVNMLMALDIDREIPPELYRTIAEVMAYVYRIDKKAKPKTKPEGHR